MYSIIKITIYVGVRVLYCIVCCELRVVKFLPFANAQSFEVRFHYPSPS